MSTLGIIPARGGSKGVKDKNIIDIAGRPLIAYTIEAAFKSKLIDKVVISTDSQRIADVVCSQFDVEVIMRPAEYAKDDSPIEESFMHAVEYLRDKQNFNTEVLVWMQPNVPIRPSGIVDRVITGLRDNDADSCVTCYAVDQIPEVMKAIDSDGCLVPLSKDVGGIRRQEFPERYLLDGSVVALKAANLFETRGIREAHIYLGQRVIPVIQSKRRYSVEIDVPDDVDLVEYYFSKETA